MRRPLIAIYILASLSRRLYIGVTSNLPKRLHEHRMGINSDFPKRYRINRLVHYEVFDRVIDATSREKELKGWRREKKTALIELTNAGWIDLSGGLARRKRSGSLGPFGSSG